MLNKIEIAIENKVSVNKVSDGHVTHFWSLKANLAMINLFFPTNTRHYQHYFHTDTVTNYHYIYILCEVYMK